MPAELALVEPPEKLWRVERKTPTLGSYKYRLSKRRWLACAIASIFSELVSCRAMRTITSWLQYVR